MDASTGRPSVRWGRVLTTVFVVAAVGFAALLLFGQWEELRRLRARVGGFGWRLAPGWLAAALALAVLNLALMGSAWVRLYRRAGGTVSYGRGLRVWVATNLGRYIPGKIWHLSGLALHLKRTGESGALALGTAVTFQVVTLLSGSAVALAVLGADVARVPAASPVVGGVVLVLLVGMLHPRVVGSLTAVAGRLTGEPVDDLDAPRVRELAGAGAALTVAWGIYGVGFWCLLQGLGGSGAPAGPVRLAGIFAAAYVAGYVVLVAPGGLVVREGAMTALLAALTPLGAAVAAAVAVVARIWVAASELVAFAGVALLAAPAAAGAHPAEASGSVPGGSRGAAEDTEAEPGGRGTDP